GVPQPAERLERHRRIYPFGYDTPGGEERVARSARVGAGTRAPVRVSGRRSPTECTQGGRRPVAERAEEFSPPEAKPTCNASRDQPCVALRERDRGGNEPLGGRAVAQLAGEIVTPAVNHAARGHAARVPEEWYNRPRAHHGERVPTDHRRGNGPLRGRTVAELTILVVTPAVRRAAHGDPAGVTITSAQRGELQSPGDRCRNELIRRSTVAQRPVEASSPAIGRAVRGDPASPRPTRAQRGEL